MERCVCLLELVRFCWRGLLRIRRTRQRHQKPDQESSTKAAREAHGLFSRSRAWRGLGPYVVLDVHNHLKFAIGLRHLARGLVGLAKQVVSNVVRWVHFDGVVEVVEGLNGLVELEKSLAEQDVRSGGAGLQQDGAVQSLLRIGILAIADIGVSEPVIQRPLRGLILRSASSS
jgi:hypothetical protein